MGTLLNQTATEAVSIPTTKGQFSWECEVFLTFRFLCLHVGTLGGDNHFPHLLTAVLKMSRNLGSTGKAQGWALMEKLGCSPRPLFILQHLICKVFGFDIYLPEPDQSM